MDLPSFTSKFTIHGQNQYCNCSSRKDPPEKGNRHQERSRLIGCSSVTWPASHKTFYFHLVSRSVNMMWKKCDSADQATFFHCSLLMFTFPHQMLLSLDMGRYEQGLLCWHLSIIATIKVFTLHMHHWTLATAGVFPCPSLDSFW